MSLKPGFNDYDSSEEQGCSSSSPSKALADLDSQTVPPLNHLSKSVRTFLQPKESPNSRKHRLNFEPSHRPLESIQEEILADSSTSPKFQEYQSASLRTESTFIIPGGTQLTRKPKPKFTLHDRGILCNGRLPKEDPRYAKEVNMDEDATQPSTQPFFDPRRLGNSFGLSVQDEADVICILHPSSIAACKAVELVASTSPQHILQNEGLSSNFEKTTHFPPRDPHAQDLTKTRSPSLNNSGGVGEAHDIMDVDSALHEDRGRTLDIALRLSSRVTDECMGFVFGRNAKVCDVVIGSQDTLMHVSKSHFRIFLNLQGIIMLQDMSTNGTIVDNQLICCKPVAGKLQPKRMLEQGSIIQIVTKTASQEIKFVLSIPTREHALHEYEENLSAYLENLKKAESHAIALGQASKAPARPLLERLTSITPTPPNISSTDNLTAGSQRFHYGMLWNGGKEYNVIGKVGKGAFATVYKLATKQSGEVFAAKELEKRRFIKNGILDHKIDNELKIMKNLCHPHIVQYVDFADEPQHLYIVMEYVPGGELLSFLHSNKAMRAIPEYMAQQVARQMCHALDYLHKLGITHRDIKPDNILISSTQPFVVKLSDFGLSKVVKDGETFLRTFCGTLLYCAPEVYPDYDRYKNGLPRRRRRTSEPTPKTSPYNQSVDVWSLAAVLYHILCGDAPYKGTTHDRGAIMLENIMSNPLSYQPLESFGVSTNGIDFLKRMLVIQPHLRSNEEQCLAHAWIRDIPDLFEIPAAPAQLRADLDAIQEEDVNEQESLDASQLSLHDLPNELGIEDSDQEGNALDVDDVARNPRSKRFKADHSSLEGTQYGDERHDDLEQSYNGLDGASQGARLFGEITPSALRSSGVFGFDTYTALGHGNLKPGDGRSDMSPLRTDPLNTRGSHTTADEIPQHIVHYPHLPAPLPVGPAPSLLGTEALVGQLNMASPGSDASALSAATAPVSPQMPEDPHVPRQTSMMLSSKRSIQEVQTDVARSPPKRLKKSVSRSHDLDEYSGSARESSIVEPTFPESVSGQDTVVESRSRSQVIHEGENQSSKLFGEKGGAGEISASKEVNSNTRESQRACKVPTANPDTVQGGLPANEKLTSTADTEGNAELGVIFGKLIPLPASIYNQAIVVKGVNGKPRWTSFGRDPSSTYQYLPTIDTRVPKNAIDILLWYPGIERAENNGEDWTKCPDVCALICTRTRLHIRINGVKLTYATDGWNYGRLMTGDVITVRGHEKDGLVKDPLEFRCEFYRGPSKNIRGPKDRFVVEKEIEKFQDFQSRKSSQTSQRAESMAKTIQEAKSTIEGPNEGGAKGAIGGDLTSHSA